jgi:hypothetical protein
VFGDAPRSLVILDPGETYWTLDEFRAEPWLSIFGYRSGQETNDDTLQWLLAGPVSKDWKKNPPRPLINLAPPFENALASPSAQRASPQVVRRAAYWSLFSAPLAGVSYGADGVLDWRSDSNLQPVSYRPQLLPTWQKALFLPAAKQMGLLADLLSSIDFWRLRPAQELLLTQPGSISPSRYIAVVRSDSGDLVLAYIPEDRILDLASHALPKSPKATWINPRTGERFDAVAIDKPGVNQFKTPDSGDWLLLLEGSRNQLH